MLFASYNCKPVTSSAGSIILRAQTPLRVGSGKIRWCTVFPLDGIRLHGMDSYPVQVQSIVQSTVQRPASILTHNIKYNTQLCMIMNGPCIATTQGGILFTDLKLLDIGDAKY